MTTTEMLELIAWQANEIRTLKTRCDDQLRVSMQLHRTRQELNKVREDWRKAYEKKQIDLMRSQKELSEAVAKINELKNKEVNNATRLQSFVRTRKYAVSDADDCV